MAFRLQDILDLNNLTGVQPDMSSMGVGFNNPTYMDDSQDTGDNFLADYNFPQDYSSGGMGGGEPIPQGSISEKIQQFIGAKDPVEPGMAQDILSNRFQQDNSPSYADYLSAGIKSLGGSVTTGQDVADSRVSNQLKQIQSIAKLGGGGNSVFAQKLQLLNSDPNTANLPDAVKLSLASQNPGAGLAYGEGGVQALPGAPDAIKQMAKSKKSGTEEGDYQTHAQIDLPRITDNGNLALTQIDELLAHPGFKYAVGTSSYGPIVKGTPAADFVSRLEQLKGGAFLQAFTALKGGGQISNIEGEKATQAITRMQRSQSEEEFINAANELKTVLQKGMTRAQNAASGQVFNQDFQGNAPQNTVHWTDYFGGK